MGIVFVDLPGRVPFSPTGFTFFSPLLIFAKPLAYSLPTLSALATLLAVRTSTYNGDQSDIVTGCGVPYGCETSRFPHCTEIIECTEEDLSGAFYFTDFHSIDSSTEVHRLSCGLKLRIGLPNLDLIRLSWTASVV
jgi:hypothetical protein